jgi:nicotinate dehydrogenase subunit B
MSPAPNPIMLNRRQLLIGGGLLVTLALAPRGFAQEAAPALSSGSLAQTPYIDAWIRIDPDGKATVFSGKNELGQGIRTALLQVVAEELDMPPAAITLISGDTDLVPDEGITAASHSMQDGGTALAIAGANVREILINTAAARLKRDPKTMKTQGDGTILAADGLRLSYGELAAGLDTHIKANPRAPRRDPSSYRILGTDLPRLDIPAKITGGDIYLQDLRLPGMLHARLLRGPSYGTRLTQPDLVTARALPDVVEVIEDGDFLAVVAQTEWAAITAMRVAQTPGYARTLPPLPVKDGARHLLSMPSQDISVLATGQGASVKSTTISASYSRPWLSHGSIGPSCAVALFQDGKLTLWSASQAVFDMKRATAELVGLPADKVQVIFTQAAGCYGQNGADDVTAEAALIAMKLPGKPIRLQWMREQEFGWEPCGLGMVTKVSASLGPDKLIADWTYEVWSNAHNTRPSTAGGYALAQQIAQGFPMPEPQPIPMPAGGGDRNANPLYDLPNMNVTYHFVKTPLLRGSAMRSLGAHLNVFSLESMMDELALAAGTDPLAFRLAHMKDERARAVMQAATDAFGWQARAPGNGRRGSGMAFARYKNQGAYCALAMEIEVEPATGEITIHRVNAAVDAGQPASPDGLRNQTEGAILQSLSWALHEAMGFDATKRTSIDWGSYPILRFNQVPGEIAVQIMDRPGQPFLGAGEAAQGPASAALANALADAAGLRLRDMPLTAEKLKAALRAL